MIDGNKPVKVKIDIDYDMLAEKSDRLCRELKDLNDGIETLKRERRMVAQELCDLYTLRNALISHFKVPPSAQQRKGVV